MSGRKKEKTLLASLETFDNTPSHIEDEILECYSTIMDESEEEDLHLNQLPTILNQLNIPTIYTKDLHSCIDYYYDFIQDKTVDVNFTNIKLNNTLKFIQQFTITTNTKDTSAILDILDIDKLIYNLNKLIKFRDHHQHILDSWKLLVDSATTGSLSKAQIESFRMKLPDLKTTKTKLNLDNDPATKKELNDSFLINMLGCCKTDTNGYLVNFSFEKEGASVSIKDFAVILGNIGELD